MKSKIPEILLIVCIVFSLVFGGLYLGLSYIENNQEEIYDSMDKFIYITCTECTISECEKLLEIHKNDAHLVEGSEKFGIDIDNIKRIEVSAKTGKPLCMYYS